MNERSPVSRRKPAKNAKSLAVIIALMMVASAVCVLVPEDGATECTKTISLGTDGIDRDAFRDTYKVSGTAGHEDDWDMNYVYDPTGQTGTLTMRDVRIDVYEGEFAIKTDVDLVIQTEGSNEIRKCAGAKDDAPHTAIGCDNPLKDVTIRGSQDSSLDLSVYGGGAGGRSYFGIRSGDLTIQNVKLDVTVSRNANGFSFGLYTDGNATIRNSAVDVRCEDGSDSAYAIDSHDAGSTLTVEDSHLTAKCEGAAVSRANGIRCSKLVVTGSVVEAESGDVSGDVSMSDGCPTGIVASSNVEVNKSTIVAKGGSARYTSNSTTVAGLRCHGATDKFTDSDITAYGGHINKGSTANVTSCGIDLVATSLTVTGSCFEAHGGTMDESSFTAKSIGIRTSGSATIGDWGIRSVDGYTSALSGFAIDSGTVNNYLASYDGPTGSKEAIDPTYLNFYRWIGSKDTAKVTFDTDGGSAVEPSEIDAVKYQRICLPVSEMYGFDLEGWGPEGGTVMPAGSYYTVTTVEDVTLKAKWKADGKLEVIFMDGESEYDRKRVLPNSLVDEPPEPTRAGCSFVGWFDGETKWDFDNDEVTKDVTLNARWEAGPGPGPTTTVTVTFVTGTPDVPAPAQQRLNSGEKATEPSVSRAGYVFTGWHDNNGNLWNFQTPVTSDITLTAHWTEAKENVTVTTDGKGNAEIVIPAGSNVKTVTVENGTLGIRLTMTGITEGRNLYVTVASANGGRTNAENSYFVSVAYADRAHTGKMVLEIPFNGTDSDVYEKTEGGYVKIDAAVSNDMITFETDHGGVYMVRHDTVSSDVNYYVLVAAIAVLILMISFVAVWVRKKS